MTMNSMRSISEPSIPSTNASSNARTRGGSFASNRKRSSKIERYRGKRLWEGRIGNITLNIMLLPWSIWWQFLIVSSVIYKYIVQLLRCYIMDEVWLFFTCTMIIAEFLYAFDWLIYMCHRYWRAVRRHIRVYRRNIMYLLYDGLSLIPGIIYAVAVQSDGDHISRVIMFVRWAGIFRVYRLYYFFRELNQLMRKSRQSLIVLENLVTTFLMVHMMSCLWYSMMRPAPPPKPWYTMGYHVPVDGEKLKFDTYLQCFYYCVCRCFNIIFGDSFPTHLGDKVLTAFMTLIGFYFFKFWFIGTYAWELVLKNWRWTQFVDSYHHMLTYLKMSGAPRSLVEQAKNYKKQLWNMKNGVLKSNYLSKFPHALQTELIFDINVVYFHNSIIFRDTGEAFMRNMSLLMEHELYLEGQEIWSQGVVKMGMFCIKRGVVEMLSDEDDESPMIAFKEGTVMGELSLFYSIPAKVTVKAATYVELQVLRRTSFMRAMAENPPALVPIRASINKRLRKAVKRQKAIEEYDKSDSRLIRTRYRPMKLLKDRLAGVEDEDPTFVDTSHLYYKDEHNMLKPKFTNEYLELYELSPHVTTVDSPSICLTSNFPWILEPNTSFTHMFDVIHFCVVLYTCMMYPALTITKEQSNLHSVIRVIVVLYLLLNIYLQLTTCIVKKGVRKETVGEIADVKMSKFGFYLDLLSVLPMNVFANSIDPKNQTILLEFSMLTPLVQVWHIWDYFNKWEKQFNSNILLICLAKYSTLLVIFCYWAGCLLYLHGCPKRLCALTSWMAQLIYFETKVFSTLAAKHESPMTASYAFGTAVVTGSGSSDYSPGGTDLFLVIVLIVICSYLNSIYYANVCSIFLLSMQRKLNFKESMRELLYFLTVNRVSVKIKARVKKFFTVQWYYNNAVSSQEIFQEMSGNVQQEVLSSEMVEILLYCPLFQDSSRDFLQTVAATAKTVLLPDNEIVQHGADIGRDMYIVQKGYCNILDCNGTVMQTIGPGSHFGVIEMLFGLPKVYTVMTTTNCILRHVEYSSLVQLWSTFPDVCQPIDELLQDEDLRQLASVFEDGKPLTGKLDNKINRIAQEIKESFVVLRSHEDHIEFVKTFEKLGCLRHLRYIFLPGCITPHGLFLKCWCILRMTFALYYTLIIPFNVAVRLRTHVPSYDWPDLFLYTDIVVMAYVSYYNEKSLLITHPLLSLTHYLKTTFIWDLVSVFPFEQLFKLMNREDNLDICRINRLLLVTRISGAFIYWESDIMRVNMLVFMFRYIPFTIAFVNFMTAVVFINGCQSFVSNSTGLLMANCSKYYFKNNILPTTSLATHEYLDTLFRVVEVFLGIGCTPYTMNHTGEIWMKIALQYTGYLYFAFMFGHIACMRSATSKALLAHTENTADLENFLYQENVDPTLTAKTLKYFEYVWKRTNGSNPQRICRRLNSALMEDTLIFMYEHALREVPLFCKVERSFIRVITQHLHEMYFLKGETVVQCRDLLHDIYIIYRGKVDVLNSYNEMVSCMGPGGMFGNFTGQPVSCSDVNVYASRSLDLLVLPSRTFFSLIKYYPKIQEPLQKAFAHSKDYILPITMDVTDDDSSEEESEDISETDTGFDSKDSGMSPGGTAGQLSTRSSHSELSQVRSFISVSTYQSYTRIDNLLRPGTFLFQVFGYITCFVATFNFTIVLYDIVTLNNCLVIIWLQAVFDIFFYIKVYLDIHQGYVNKRGDFIVDSSRCRSRYMKHKSWKWIDLLVNLPLTPLCLCFSNPSRIVHYLRFNKLFRLVYLFEFYRKTAAELTNNLTTLQTVTTFCVVILLVHTASCLWLITMTAVAPIAIIRDCKLHLVDEDSPNYKWDYATSLYVVISELTSTGGDEFVIFNAIPVIILLIAIASGKWLAATIVATSIQVSYATKHAITNYERNTNAVFDVLKNQGLSGYQVKKYWRYVQQLWVNERGRQLPVLLEQTPYVRRCVLMSAMFGHHLRNCYLFTETEEPFLRQLCAAMDYTVFFPGNYIVTAGESEARMYWVVKGMVSVVSVRGDLTETTHETLGYGDVFGILQGLSRGIIHVFSYRAETNVSVLSLCLDAWVNIIHFFPEAQNLINERSEHLFTQIAP